MVMKFLTKKIMGAQNFNSALNFPKTGGFNPKFCFFGRKLLGKKVLEQFSNRSKLKEPGLQLHYPATMPKERNWNYDRNIRTVPRINARQMGQFRSDGAQLLQQDKWPHGKKTTLTSSSMQTLHVFASLSWRFSSSKLFASEQHSSHS